VAIKPKIRRHGRQWECQLEYLDGSRAFWQFETWWQAMSCGLVLAEGQVPWMFPVHISAPKPRMELSVARVDFGDEKSS